MGGSRRAYARSPRTPITDRETTQRQRQRAAAPAEHETDLVQQCKVLWSCDRIRGDHADASPSPCRAIASTRLQLFLVSRPSSLCSLLLSPSPLRTLRSGSECTGSRASSGNSALAAALMLAISVVRHRWVYACRTPAARPSKEKCGGRGVQSVQNARALRGDLGPHGARPALHCRHCTACCGVPQSRPGAPLPHCCACILGASTRRGKAREKKVVPCMHPRSESVCGQRTAERSEHPEDAAPRRRRIPAPAEQSG